jgi:hypothetical protein
MTSGLVRQGADEWSSILGGWSNSSSGFHDFISHRTDGLEVVKQPPYLLGFYHLVQSMPTVGTSDSIEILVQRDNEYGSMDELFQAPAGHTHIHRMSFGRVEGQVSK